MTIQHQNLAQVGWQELSCAQKLANIGSEVHRALNWQKKGNDEYSRKAVVRALELIDISFNLLTAKSQLKEFARLRETLVDYFYGDNQYLSSPILFQKYFNYFNFLVSVKR